MRRTILLLTACTALLLSVSPSRAAFVTGCCACVGGHEGTVSSTGPRLTPALFCTNVMGEGYPDFVSACNGAGGEPVCTDEVPGQSCSQTLAAAEAILCPAAGAPAAGALGLLGLAAALGAAGLWHVRRR